MLFLFSGLGFVLVTLFVSKLLRPNRPNKEKLSTYESGEDTVGNAWIHFDIKYYVIAIIFLLFEVELIFLFPWALVFDDKLLNEQTEGKWGIFAMVETFIFISLLVIGLGYVWAKKLLEWPKPPVIKEHIDSPVPMDRYQKVNKKYK